MNNLLIYYGWLNSFNSAQNGWDNQKVAQEMAKYDLIVLGNGIQDPSHGDFSNTQVIIPRIKALNPSAKIFGYVTINQDLSTFKTKANQWNNLQVHGIFLDEAGYDYGKKRSEFNERVIHVKNLDYANICFANAWNINHVMGIANDTSYPNTTYNPDEYESLLDSNDWYLLESFAVNTSAYTGSYASKTDWKARGEAAVEKRDIYSVNMAAVNVINDDNANGQTMFDFTHRAAQMFDLEASGSSDTNYGASSAKTKMWTRPDPKIIEKSQDDISVTADVSDNNIYYRYTKHNKIKLNWTSGSQSSSIDQW